ncbi:PilW family protein [Elongatibacter sediminis]|uniref:Prepilin-type N-terminal cleavage/methylation domain-containing protein n=1 Tax=Elongatibacter sediminis TaxID=3119006 RepID=A0AAW9RGE8_9GAMM
MIAMKRHKHCCGPRTSRGFSLMEVIVATSISLVVTASMVGLMINSLSNTSRVVKMSKLTDDMRIALQMMTRDVRRSNYSADAVLCFANPDCASDGTVAWSGDVQISQDGDCFIYQLDRDFDGDMTENGAGAFRRTVQNGVGVIEMWVGSTVPDCDGVNANWGLVTDPNDITITGFSVDDTLSYAEVIWDDGEGNQFQQKVRKLRLSISGELTTDASISRRIDDVIKLRNNLYM